MVHYLSENLFNRFLNLHENDSLYLPWQIILSDDTLCPALRKERIDIYYRGFKAFSLTDGGIFRNHDAFENDLYVFDVPEEISEEQFLQYLPYMKQNIDLWMGSGNKGLYEREYAQLIMRENNSKTADSLSDYFIIDMEHQYEKGGFASDLIGIIAEHGKCTAPVCRMSIIAVKYMNRSLTGPAGIYSQIADYVRLISDSEMLGEVRRDINEMIYQSKMLGLLPGHRNKYNRIDLSDERPELLLALISVNKSNGIRKKEDDEENLRLILENAINEYGDILDDVYVAKAAETGFALYNDRKVGLKSYCSQL